MLIDRIEELKKTFASFSDWEARYGHIIHLGKQLQEYPDHLRGEEFKVKGCQSQVWLHPEFKEGKIVFQGDSDAAIVKGVVAVLLFVYSDSTPEEILSVKPDFLDEIGLKEHLSMSRANGLASMLKQIYLYATAFKYKAKM